MPHLRDPRFTAALLSIAAIFSTGSTSRGAAPASGPADSPAARVKEQILKMTDFLDTMLPGVLEDRNIALHFTPKFSDFRDEEYVRFPVELRYGLGSNWELLGGITPFTPNPFNGGRDHRWGPGEVKIGARYDVAHALGFFDDTTFGLEMRVPLGKPPVDLNDHYTHVKPFVSGARKLLSWPDVTFYANLSYDRSVELYHREAPPPEVVRKNIIEAVPGLLFKPAEFGYFTEYRFRHITEEHEWHLAHEVRFGTIWDVPLARSEGWNLPGKWQLELAYKVSHEEGRGTDQGIAARVNWRTTIREVLAHVAKKSSLSR